MKITKILKKAGKWLGYIVLGLVLLLLLVYGYAQWRFTKDANTVYSVAPIDIQIPYDSLSIAKGKHLFTVHGCKDCHGPDLRGGVISNDAMFGYFKIANLTTGKGGLPEGFSDQDWLRALKHGINKEGKSLLVMPSNESSRIPDKDLAAIIAYCKSVRPVDNEMSEQKPGPLAKVLHSFGKFNFMPATQIDHSISPITKPEETVSAEYGATLAINCTACHRENYGGGPPVVPGHPPVPNISSTGRQAKWTEEQFIQTLRTGVTPDGHKLDNEKMPWKRFGEFSDVEIKAVRAYILTFPKKQIAQK